LPQGRSAATRFRCSSSLPHVVHRSSASESARIVALQRSRQRWQDYVVSTIRSVNCSVVRVAVSAAHTWCLR
jgi:hypothetical protein